MMNVIACIDGTNVSTAVSDYAAWASLRLDAPLILLHVLDKSTYPVSTNLSGNIGLGSREALLNELAELDEKRSQLALEQGRLMLEGARQRVLSDGVSEPVVHQRHGSLLDSLLAIEQDTRLLVLGKHEENLNERIGSRLENIVRALHRPMLVTTDEFNMPQRIMIAYDGSATTKKCVETVAASPLFRGLPCHLVMVGQGSEEQQAQMDWARQILHTAGFEVVSHIEAGEVESVLCAYRKSQDIDLLVMGAYGHSRIRQFFVGSTTTSVIRNARVPVLLLR